MADSPGSPLSSHSSSEFTDQDVKFDHDAASVDLDVSLDLDVPPSKRQKTGASSFRSTPQYDMHEDGEISSDTSGSAPTSPVMGAAAYLSDDASGEQVTACKWRNCPVGDMGNLDRLVNHIQDQHIDHHTGRATKKFVCEWEGCARLDVAHASAYALKQHMRSHTREKPNYCALPECDKSFTRSDALAKHMRTVHETEALRPSDPVPRGHSQAQMKPQKLKLTFKKGNLDNGVGADEDMIDGDPLPDGRPGFVHPPDVQFTDEELSASPAYLYKLCRRQVHWSSQEGERLKRECAELEVLSKEEWQKKTLLMMNAIEFELEGTNLPLHEGDPEKKHLERMASDLLPSDIAVKLPMSQKANADVPWDRRAILSGLKKEHTVS